MSVSIVGRSSGPRLRYGQFCALARALDVIGDRWTLLLVRELFGGPRRHRELKQGLPGMASNLLAERLRELRGAGILERVTIDGAPHYRLTERGRELRPVLVELARWGGPLLGDLDDSAEFQPSWLLLTLDARLDRGAAGDRDTAVLLEIDGQAIDVAVSARDCAHRPAVHLTSSSWPTGGRSWSGGPNGSATPRRSAPACA